MDNYKKNIRIILFIYRTLSIKKRVGHHVRFKVVMYGGRFRHFFFLKLFLPFLTQSNNYISKFSTETPNIFFVKKSSLHSQLSWHKIKNTLTFIYIFKKIIKYAKLKKKC